MKYLCIKLIRFYQKVLSPLKGRPCCRFTPTCSAYAIEAYQKRGFFVGSALTVYRILRCNPFCPGGWDPVPDKGFFTKRVQVRLEQDFEEELSDNDEHDDTSTTTDLK